MADELDSGHATAIAEELRVCRQRGIERLDVSSHNQVPVQAPVLERLASEYIRLRQLHAYGRISQLKYLFRDAIKAFAGENEADAQLVGDLFFGDSLNRVTKSAGELLDMAREKSGYRNETLFRQARRAAFIEFARFLPEFVEDARPESAERPTASAAVPGSVSVLPQLQTTPNDGVPDPEVQRHEATTGYVDNGQHFVHLLAEAVSATIVGLTNEKLATMLWAALERKRALVRPDACWESLRIVFLSDKLLDLINDERMEYPDPEEVLKQRRRAAVYGRRSVSNFLRSMPPAAGKTYELHHVPPLVGTLFEMPNGQRIIQLLIRRPERNAAAHLYLQLEDTQGHYFSAAFEEIVHGSVDDNKVVPVGIPTAEGFRVTGSRYLQNVLKDGSHANGWLPLVLVVTWRIRGGRAEPLLQLRSQLSFARELDRLSHLSRHIFNDDRGPEMSEFGTEDAIPLRAARRRVQMETGEEDRGILQPLGTSEYLYPDKENLYFFVYSCELPESLQLPREDEIFPVPLPELLAIRENQALRMALLLCESPPMRRKARADAFEIAGLNLTLHGHADVAQRLTDVAGRSAAAITRVASEIRELVERTRQTWPGLEQLTVVMGLSGLQYREFFSFLLPFYERVGVPGAADHLRLINGNDKTQLAVARLAELYHDEGIMESIPLEL